MRCAEAHRQPDVPLHLCALVQAVALDGGLLVALRNCSARCKKRLITAKAPQLKRKNAENRQCDRLQRNPEFAQLMDRSAPRMLGRSFHTLRDIATLPTVICVCYGAADGIDNQHPRPNRHAPNPARLATSPPPQIHAMRFDRRLSTGAIASCVGSRPPLLALR